MLYPPCNYVIFLSLHNYWWCSNKWYPYKAPPPEGAPNFQEIFLIPTYHNSEFDIFICIVAISWSIMKIFTWLVTTKRYSRTCGAHLRNFGASDPLPLAPGNSLSYRIMTTIFWVLLYASRLLLCWGWYFSVPTKYNSCSTSSASLEATETL